MTSLPAAFGSLIVAGLACAATPPPAATPPELGKVQWERDLDAGLRRAAAEDRPVFLLFQEIPGCQGCVDFGSGPLTHPLMVEAIETLAVPVAIHNNKPGRDDEVRKRFEEPAWNYPVVRFVNAKGVDLIPRRDRVWTTPGVATRFVEALEVAGAEVPAYLRLTAEETAKRETATFAMACFWEGEAQLGKLDGVLATRAGWVDRHEVVEVEYDPERIAYATLLDQARTMQCASVVFTHSATQQAEAGKVVGNLARPLATPARDAKPADQLFALRRTPLRYVPLTRIQATRINATLRADGDPRPWLSPAQRALAAEVQAILEADPARLEGLDAPRGDTGWEAHLLRLRAAVQSPP